MTDRNGFRQRRLAAILGAAAWLAGCGRWPSPEPMTTTRVAGTVNLGGRPVPSGFVEFHPVDGTVGLLRIAPIRADGTFEADRVPVGRVAIALARLPVGSIPTSAGPVDPRRLTLNPFSTRRTIPAGPEPGRIDIDLIEEAARLEAGDRGRGRPRRRRKRARSGPMGPPRALEAEGGSPPEDDRATASGRPTTRIVYRDGAGSVHVDWPEDRLAEALGDVGATVWVDIEDLTSTSNNGVEALMRDAFQFHPLAIEDALKDSHVPRIDDWKDYLYLTFDSVDFEPLTDAFHLRELDIFIGRNYLLTYHNEPIAILEKYHRNIAREPEGRLREGPGHLLYRLLDDMIDDFLVTVDHLDDAIEAAQDEVFANATPRTLQKIFRIKSCGQRLHRLVIPMREVVNRLARDPFDPIRAEHQVYFRDVYDHLVRLHDITESLRDQITGALDTYLSIVSNRTNDIMKVLTLLNVMFLPMTFLAGFFGMNFFGETLMFQSPQLPRAYMFWATVGLMVSTPIIMWGVARRRGWF